MNADIPPTIVSSQFATINVQPPPHERVHAFALETRRMASRWYEWLNGILLVLGLVSLAAAAALIIAAYAHELRFFDRAIPAVILIAISVTALTLFALMYVPFNRPFLLPHDSSDEIAADIAAQCAGNQASRFPGVLAERHPGHVALLETPGGEPLDVTPVLTPFEPLNIWNLSTAWLLQLSPTQSTQEPPQTTPPPRYRRIFALVFEALVIGFALWGLGTWATGTLTRVWSGRPLTMLDYQFFLFAGFAQVIAGILIFGRRRESYVCCGGIIARSASVFSGRWRVDLFEASKSGLVAERVFDGGEWNVTVASGARTLHLPLDRERLQVLLSCWLSPLPSPTPEQVSDFE